MVEHPSVEIPITGDCPQANQNQNKADQKQNIEERTQPNLLNNTQ